MKRTSWSRSTSRSCSAGVAANVFKPGATILLESMWRDDSDPAIAASYAETVERLVDSGFRVIEIPIELECRKLVADPRHGKNMFALGILCNLYSLDLRLAREQDRAHLRQEGRAGRHAGTSSCSRQAGRGRRKTSTSGTRSPPQRSKQPQIVVNGNTALALGVLASGMDICAMYPDHAGHLGLALSERGVRERRRHRPSGRGRDRRVRVRDRRIVRGQGARSRSPRARATRSSRRPSGSR